MRDLDITIDLRVRLEDDQDALLRYGLNRAQRRAAEEIRDLTGYEPSITVRVTEVQP